MPSNVPAGIAGVGRTGLTPPPPPPPPPAPDSRVRDSSISRPREAQRARSDDCRDITTSRKVNGIRRTEVQPAHGTAEIPAPRGDATGASRKTRRVLAAACHLMERPERFSPVLL